MSKYSILIFLLLTNYFGEAQIVQKKESSSQQKTTTPAINNNTSANKQILKLKADAECIVKIDGESKGIIKAGEIKKIYLSKGQYEISCISTKNSKDEFTEIYTVDEVNIEMLYKIELAKKISERTEAEGIEKNKGSKVISEIPTYNGTSYNPITQISGSESILMTIGNKQITKSEFEYLYKVNSKKNTSKPLITEYAEQFALFKMKVFEAEGLKMDTSKSFIDELSGYQKQLSAPYLKDNLNDELQKEAIDRLPIEIRASHILVKLSADAQPKDTLIAFNKILNIRARIVNGEDFNTVAIQPGISDDPSVKENQGDLGYFKVFDMVYPFETAAFNAKVGEISMPIRSRFGYHIIKVTDKRKRQGEILTAHIMLRSESDKLSANDSKITKDKIDEIYQLVKSGKNFAELAKQYSDDKASATNGGKLQWFGTGRMPIEFEKTAFDLKFNGDISKPIQTKFGWHIIKQIDRKDFILDDKTIQDYKQKRLESLYPEFKNLVKEYRDGILLFDLTDRKVWSKAVKDVDGLKSYYDEHKSVYGTKSLEEAKGIITADFQTYLEQQWINELRQKYPVNIDKSLLNTIN